MSFKGDVLKLVSGTAIAQAITVASAPILTRMYAPEFFGNAALFASVAGILGIVAALSYEQAIVVSDDDREAANLLVGCLALTCVTSLIVCVFLGLFGKPFLAWLNFPQLLPFIWLIPLSVLAQGVVSATSYWNTRVQKFGNLAISQVASQITASGTSIVGGVAGHAVAATMIAGGVAGQAVAAVAIGKGIWSESGRDLREHVRLGAIVSALRKHQKFPLYTSASALLNAASWQLPVIMLGALFSPAVAGFYALGFRMLQMPMSLVGRSISQVFLQRATAEHVQGNLSSLVRSLFQRLLLVGLLPSLILAILGRELFAFAFGTDWTEAGIYAQVLALWALVWFVSSPLSSLYYILGKQQQELKIQLIIFSTRLISIWLGAIFHEPLLAVALFAISGLFVYGYLVIILFGFARLGASSALDGCLVPLRDGFLLALPILLLKLMNTTPILLILASGGVLALFVGRHRKVFQNI